MLVNGVWQEKWNPYQKQDLEGAFIRQTSSFRHWVSTDGSPGRTGDAGFIAQPGRYHLYIALICPWASRTLMMRKLKGLEKVISISVVEPFLTDEGWRFAPKQGGFHGSDSDVVNNKEYVHQLYTQVDPRISGRATVPILWDKQRQCIVNNESADIIEMLNSAFDEYAENDIDLRPQTLLSSIEKLNKYLYHNLNNAVYETGFAVSQSAYESAYSKVFTALDTLELQLSDGRAYLLGETMTECDIRAFVTLVRFDVAYHGLFKCNRKRISDYPWLSAYTVRIYDLDGISETVNFTHIKNGYYSVAALNPNLIVPTGPLLSFTDRSVS